MRRLRSTQRLAGDPDLGFALAQLGFSRVSGGQVDEGLAQLDEAMAAATSGGQQALRRLQTSAAR